MTIVTAFNFQNQDIRFEQRGDRVWGCLTDMAKATNKLVADYLRLKSTVEFVTKFESNMGIPIISSQVGGDVSNTGTWAIEEVVLDFAAWCSVDFRIWMIQQIKTLLTAGSVSIVEPKPEPQIPLINRQGLDSLQRLMDIVKLAMTTGNMRLLQQAENGLSQYYDAFVSLNQTQTSNLFPPAEQNQKRYEAIIDVAIRLGKKIPHNLESSLGRYAGKHIGYLRQENKDNRTAAVSGKRLNVYLYPANEPLVERCVLDYCLTKGI